MSIFDTLAKEAKNDYAKLVSDATSGDKQGFIGTGSYILNAQLSVVSMVVYPTTE